MSEWNLTPEEIRAVSLYIDEGVRSEETPAALDKILYAAAQASRRLSAENAALGRRLERSNDRVQRLQAKREEAVLQEEFSETGLDSLAVAKCLLYYLQQQNAWKLSRSKLMYVLFEVYAAWLAGHRERLFVEHPVASEYGPQFWRVFKNIPSTGTPLGREAVEAIAKLNPGVAALCRNAAVKYYDYKESDLQRYICKCPAYRNALPEKNGGKWNGELRDSEIYAWKLDQKKGE